MAYSITLLDTATGSEFELDTEDIDFSMIVGVTDVSDISKRNEKISREISFKGTKRNKQAFGHPENLNKFTDFSIGNLLGPNYNALRKVDCLIYENEKCILRGTIREIETTVDKNGNVTYVTQVTGPAITLMQLLSENTLDALDFTDYRHKWEYSRIKDSWATRIEKFDGTAYSWTPFKLGSGYVYPFADYGETFKNNTLNANRFNPLVHIKNFRPAIYFREYLERIFKQNGLNGYSFEFKGEPGFEEMINSLIVLNNVEVMKTKNFTWKWRLKYDTQPSTGSYDPKAAFDGSKQYEHPLSFDSGLALSPVFSANAINYYGNYRGSTKAVLKVDRTFTCDTLTTITLSNINNPRPTPVRFNLDLCEREWINATTQVIGITVPNDEFNKPETWKNVASIGITIPANANNLTKTFTLDAGDHEFLEGTQILFRIRYDQNVFFSPILSGTLPSFKVQSGDAAFPKNQTSSGFIHMNTRVGDYITPTVPENVKQIDFLKSFINMFNLYMYTDPSRPKHFIFETYDYFYRFCHPKHLKQFALDWTRKIDLNALGKSLPNLKVPKKYLFTYKSDNDLVNKDYQDNYNRVVYGTEDFTDMFGITDQKKVEVIFSPTPASDYVGTDRIHPVLLVKDGSNIKPVKTNIRLVFYNGMKTCTKYTVADDAVTTVNGISSWTKYDIEADISSYANASEYYFPLGPTNMLPTMTLQFGRPQRLYLGKEFNFETTPNLYQKYYKNQVDELTDANVRFIEVQAYLDEVDMANLDLRTPVFIDWGLYGGQGHSYFKVLEVDYKNAVTPARLKLQKIVW